MSCDARTFASIKRKEEKRAVARYMIIMVTLINVTNVAAYLVATEIP